METYTQEWQLLEGDFRPDPIRETIIKIYSENGNSRFLRNVGTYPKHCYLNTVSIPTIGRIK
jgi:hypothetical protein